MGFKKLHLANFSFHSHLALPLFPLRALLSKHTELERWKKNISGLKNRKRMKKGEKRRVMVGMSYFEFGFENAKIGS